MATWQLQTAKAKLSELLRAVREDGPQTISVRGKEEYVVMRKGEEPSKQKSAPKTWDELVAPVRGLLDDLELPKRDEPKGVRERAVPFDDDSDDRN